MSWWTGCRFELRSAQGSSLCAEATVHVQIWTFDRHPDLIACAISSLAGGYLVRIIDCQH